jgi:hypothetical protein
VSRSGGYAGQRNAIFAVGVALDAGFCLRAPRGDSLDVIMPPGTPHARCASIREALEAHEAEVIAFLQWLGDEASLGITWTPPRRWTAQ